MSSQVPVANSGIAARALEYVEQAPLSSLADSDPIFQRAARTLVEARQMCLQAEDWAVSSQTVPLAKRADYVDPTGAARVAWMMPPNNLTIREVIVDQHPGTYAQEGQSLLTQAATSVVLRHSVDLDREDQLGPHLRNAIALQMAVLLSPYLSTSRSKRQDLKADLQDAMADARRYNARAASWGTWNGEPANVDWIAEALR
ncbi:MAG: hypothetical protein AAFY65_01350 [Pseudomonadota bacterium]